MSPHPDLPKLISWCVLNFSAIFQTCSVWLNLTMVIKIVDLKTVVINSLRYPRFPQSTSVCTHVKRGDVHQSHQDRRWQNRLISYMRSKPWFCRDMRRREKIENRNPTQSLQRASWNWKPRLNLKMKINDIGLRSTNSTDNSAVVS